MPEVLSLGRRGRSLLLRRPRTKALRQLWGCSQAGRVGSRGVKVGGFCNEDPGAERAGRRCLPEKGNQSGQLSGVPRGGTEALTPGRAGSPGLPPSLDHQSARPGGPSVCGPCSSRSRTEYREDGGCQARRPCSAAGAPGPIPPGHPLPGSSRPALRSQTHLERGSWQKNLLRGSKGSANPVCLVSLSQGDV